MSYSKNSAGKSKDKKKRRVIILTGFRATGKTVVGRELAELLGFDFLDTDEELSRRFGTRIADFVASQGWAGFRREEELLLSGLCDRKSLVLATGGGCILHREVWRRLRDNGIVVWLQATRETILHRLQADDRTGAQRPSLTGAALQEEVDALLAERIPLYRAGSDFQVRVEGHSPRALGRIIQKLLQESD